MRTGLRILQRARLGSTPPSLFKGPGEQMTISWRNIQNIGGQTSHVVMHVRVIPGGAILGHLGPVGVIASSQVTLQASVSAPLVTGPYIGEVLLEETDASGAIIRRVASGTFQLNVSQPAVALGALYSPNQAYNLSQSWPSPSIFIQFGCFFPELGGLRWTFTLTGWKAEGIWAGIGFDANPPPLGAGPGYWTQDDVRGSFWQEHELSWPGWSSMICP